MIRNRWLSFLSPFLLLTLWELAVQVGWLNRIFYPPPSEVFITFGAMIADGQLPRDVGLSVMRVFVGMVIGGVPAIVIGLLMGISPVVRALVQPLAAAIYPIPKIALLPLVIVVLGLGEASKIATIALSVFFMIVLNVAASVLQVDARYFEVAQSFGARRIDLFRTVALPASMPGIITSVKLGMGFALTLIVGVEFVGSNDGVGHLIWRAYELYAIDSMIAGLVAVALVGWAITVLLDEIERLLVPWQFVRAANDDARQFIQTWWGALRPHSYTAAIIPVALGAIIAGAEGHFHPLLLTLALLGAIAIQAGANLTNDYFDYTRGIDTPQSFIGRNVLLRGELQPRQVLIAGLVAFAVGAIIGLYLVSVGGAFILWLGVIGVLVGFFYTAGPFALAYTGLGETAVFLFMGPLTVIGSYYLQTQSITAPVIFASLPVGFLIAASLHANNLRDLESDRAKGKRTLATLLGRAGANIEYYALVGGAYLSLLLLALIGVAPWPTLIAAITLPTALGLMRRVARDYEPQALHPVLRQTTQLHMQFGFLMLAGWAGAWMLGMS